MRQTSDNKSLWSALRGLLHDPRVRGVPPDAESLLGIHREVVRTKPLLRSAFTTFYEDMTRLCDRHFTVPGVEIELGSGAGFFKELRPWLVTSDIRKGDGIDIELDAQDMALGSDTVRCIYAVNVFHHLQDPLAFFRELHRVLRKGGGCILIEPHGGPLSALVHRHLHSDEYFDPTVPDWRTETIGGPLSGANQAMAHVVFERDRARFEAQFTGMFEIVHRGYELNALRYLFSGGVNYRQLLPTFLHPLLIGIEKLGAPLARSWSLHQIIVLRKT